MAPPSKKQRRSKASCDDASSHPDVGKSNPRRSFPPTSTTKISSGACCFGMVHNCLAAASRPIVHPSTFNISDEGPPDNSLYALNGTWLVYRFDKKRNKKMAKYYGVGHTTKAWFLCHESCDPVEECRRLLKLSVDCQGGGARESFYTTPHHLRESGVLIVNRYDWGVMQPRGADLFEKSEGTLKFSKSEKKLSGENESDDEVKDSDDEDEEEQAMRRSSSHNFRFTDYEKVKEKDFRASPMMWTGGDWTMGRIGFDDEKAISLLVYDDGVDFCELKFPKGTRSIGEEDW